MNDRYKYYSEAGTVWYPVKTNSLILNELNAIFEEKNGFLISCMEHYKKLKNENISNERIGLINIYASDDVYQKLYAAGIRIFTFDSIEKLKKFALSSDISSCRISIRLSLSEIFKDYISPIGAPFQEAHDMIAFLYNNNCSNIGISIYFPEGYKTKEIQRVVFTTLLKEFSQIEVLSIGGLTEELSEIKKIYNKDIILEIGYDLVLDNSKTTKIIRKRIVNNIYTLVIDRGIYTGFFDSILKHRNFELSIETDDKDSVKLYQHMADERTKLTLFGGSGNADDFIGNFFIENRNICKIKEGDIMHIKAAGAYFDELITLYGKDLMS